MGNSSFFLSIKLCAGFLLLLDVQNKFGHLYFKYGLLNYESGVCMSSVIEKVLSSKLGEVENNV